MSHTFTFDDEELQCLQVCVSNAPIPYDISQKEVPANILAKIGEPVSYTHLTLPTTPYV